jgi:hypothetical protein
MADKPVKITTHLENGKKKGKPDKEKPVISRKAEDGLVWSCDTDSFTITLKTPGDFKNGKKTIKGTPSSPAKTGPLKTEGDVEVDRTYDIEITGSVVTDPGYRVDP